MAVGQLTQSNILDGVKFHRLNQFSILPIEFLVIAGGGRGGDTRGGGGGAGGYINSVAGELSGANSLAVPQLIVERSTNYTVTVGAGGAAAGGNSVFHTNTAIGGARGGNEFASGALGGSGSGSGIVGPAPSSVVAGAGTALQGFAGGRGSESTCGGGGGGASAAGSTAIQGGAAGNGGNGLSSSITGVATTRAGGGGGGGRITTGNPSGVGGAGGGGDGAPSPSPLPGFAGVANTGGGGGGGSGTTASAGGFGGSGIVILRYPNSLTITIGAGLTGTTATLGNKK